MRRDQTHDHAAPLGARRGVPRAARQHPATGTTALSERGSSLDWLLVDGSSLVFRAFFGVPQSVRAPDGRAINAVRGFVETLHRLLVTRRPARIAVAEDADWRPAWRVEQLPGYKAHRTAEPVPPGLIPQLPIVDEVLDAVGIDRAGVPDYEAEDVIASWVAKTSGRVEIASGDRDLFALVDQDRVSVLFPEKSGLAVVDEAEVARRYNIPGRSYTDFAILRGDPSDGLPGLRGVGAVAAAGLVRRYGSVGALLEAGTLDPTARDYVARAARIVPPVATLPLELPAGRRPAYPANAEQLERLTESIGIRATLDRLVEALRSVAQR